MQIFISGMITAFTRSHNQPYDVCPISNFNLSEMYNTNHFWQIKMRERSGCATIFRLAYVPGSFGVTWFSRRNLSFLFEFAAKVRASRISMPCQWDCIFAVYEYYTRNMAGWVWVGASVTLSAIHNTIKGMRECRGPSSMPIYRTWSRTNSLDIPPILYVTLETLWFRRCRIWFRVFFVKCSMQM